MTPATETPKEWVAVTHPDGSVARAIKVLRSGSEPAMTSDEALLIALDEQRADLERRLEAADKALVRTAVTLGEVIERAEKAESSLRQSAQAMREAAADKVREFERTYDGAEMDLSLLEDEIRALPDSAPTEPINVAPQDEVRECGLAPATAPSHCGAAPIAEPSAVQLRADGVVVHQWRRAREHEPWYDAEKEDAYSRVDAYYEARTLYSAPASPAAAKECITDAQRIDALERFIEREGGLRIHNGDYQAAVLGLATGSHRATCNRTLRQALDSLVTALPPTGDRHE